MATSFLNLFRNKLVKIGSMVLLSLPLLAALLYWQTQAQFNLRLRDQILLLLDLELLLALAVFYHLPRPNYLRSVRGLIFTACNGLLASLIYFYFVSHKELKELYHVYLYKRAYPFLALALGGLLLAHLLSLSWHKLPGWYAGLRNGLHSISDTSNDPLAQFDQRWLLAGLFVVGIVLRLINLGGFPPYSDEDNHTHVALQLLNGIPVTYFRSYLLVTLPVFLSFKLLGVSMFAARLPMVLLNMLAIFPLFRLGKKVNTSVGLLAVFLFVTSPWLIATARTVREYAVLPTLLFLSANALLNLLDLDHEDLWRSIKAKTPDLIVAAGTLVYIVLIDPRSFYFIALINYFLFFLYFALDVFRNKRSKKLMAAIAGVTVLAIAGALYVVRRIAAVEKVQNNLHLAYQKIFLNSLFQNPDQNWYRLPVLGAVLLVLFVLLFAKALTQLSERSKRVEAFMYAGFGIIVLLLSFIFFASDFPVRVRYGVLMIYFMVPCVALVLFSLFRLIQLVVQRPLLQVVIFAALVCVFFVNYGSFGIIYNYHGGAGFPITGNNHFVGMPAYEYLSDKFAPGEALLSNAFYYYDEMNGNKLHQPVRLHFNNLVKEEGKSVAQVVSPYQSGWVALFPDAYPQDYGLQLGDLTLGGKNFSYHGQVGDVYLWHWTTP